MRELRAVHKGLVSGQPPELPDLTASYESYARDQQRWLAGSESAATERYWREQLAGPPAGCGAGPAHGAGGPGASRSGRGIGWRCAPGRLQDLLAARVRAGGE